METFLEFTTKVPKKKLPTYPTNHVAAIQVPKGGSCCSKCKWWDTGDKHCENKYYGKWAGTKDIPVSPDEFCSDWFEPKE